MGAIRESTKCSISRQLSKDKRKSIVKSIIPSKTTPQFKVIYNGEDVTPVPLSPLIFDEGKEKQMNVVDIAGSTSMSPHRTMSTFKTISANKLKSELFKMGARSTFAKSMYENEEDISIDEKTSESASFLGSELFDEGIEGEPKDMPKYVSLILVETDTFYILDINSSSEEKGSAEGDLTETDNQLYDFLTTGKGRNRKVVNQEIQTVPMVLKSRETQLERICKKHDYAFASDWDMFDTYNKGPSSLKCSDESETSESDDDLSAPKNERDSKHNDTFMLPEERQMIKLAHNQKFQDAVDVIQRLLANNNFNAQQKRFRGLSDPDPFRKNLEYNYNLNLLWTFKNEITKGLRVSCMKWNPVNNDILAVGYGKFYFNDKENGMVMLWNIKNPVQPERIYDFHVPVTALDFSKMNPNLLGVAFYDGYIKIVDVSSRSIRIICQTTRNTFKCFEAIWELIFEKEKNRNSEQIISFGQDGRICKTGPIGAPAMITTQIMRVVKGEGKLKGLQTIRKCRNPAVEVCRFPSCLVGTFHPAESHIYYVGTNEGVVYKCSKHYFHQHLSAILAHDGAVNTMKFSPFCRKLLMTCGDDWNIRIWCEEVDDPVLELKVDMQSVQYADWSPIHSTIIASVSGKDIHVWDLQRKTYTSQSSIKSPTNCRNTVVIFTRDGRCITVGDVYGNVHIFSLEDMPFPPFFQANLLTTSLRRALVSRPNLLHQVLRVGNLDYDKNTFEDLELKSS